MPQDTAVENAKMEQMGRWLDAVADRLDVDPGIVAQDQDVLLDLIATVAHGPSRPGAPMTAFVVGYVAASTGRPVAEIAGEITALADDWH